MTADDDLVARLDELLEATPEPPADLEPDEVIEAFTRMARARAAVLTDLALLAAKAGRDDRVRKRQDQLELRDRSWMSALGEAQRLVERRMGAARRAQRSLEAQLQADAAASAGTIRRQG